MSALLKNKVVLFFIVGIVPTALELDAIARLENEAAVVRVRTLTQDTTFGTRGEIADGIAILDVAGLPAAYALYTDYSPAPLGTEAVVVANGDAVSVKSAAGTAQIETATVVATITVQGDVSVTVTAAALGGSSPRVFAVRTVVGDTANTTAAKIRAALAADAILVKKFTVSGANAAVILTAKIKAANDATLNIALATGTATGLTTAASSANTTAGVAPTESAPGTAIVAGSAIQGVLV